MNESERTPGSQDLKDPPSEPPDSELESTEDSEEVAAPAFKYSIFGFEVSTLPEELRIIQQVGKCLKRQYFGTDTLFQAAGTVDEAAVMIDEFKAKNCGSAYTLAVININQFPSDRELEFLLGAKVLGEPRTIFLVSLKNLQGPLYAVAKDKVEREADLISQGAMMGAPSCVDSYTKADLDEAAERAALILNAHLEEMELRARAKQTGTVLHLPLSPAAELMHRFSTIYYGRRSTSKSGMYPRLRDDATSANVRRPSSSRRSDRMEPPKV